MNSISETLINNLQATGMRLTPQRLAICELLADNRDHPTATQIYKELKVKYPSLSLATVYNTLDLLVNIGCINALGNAWDDNLHYDANTEPHINLLCISCHAIEDLPSSHVNHLVNEIVQSTGFQIFGARIAYYGLCAACQNNQAENKNSTKRKEGKNGRKYSNHRNAENWG